MLNNPYFNNENGIDTSDATATANQIQWGQTAYVKGEKITGTIPRVTEENEVALSKDITVSTKKDSSSFIGKFPEDYIMRTGSIVSLTADNDVLANKIGLTANKIVEGYNILGVAGTGGGGVRVGSLIPQDLQATLGEINNTTSRYSLASGAQVTAGIVTAEDAESIEETVICDRENNLIIKIKDVSTAQGNMNEYNAIIFNYGDSAYNFQGVGAYTIPSSAYFLLAQPTLDM